MCEAKVPNEYVQAAKEAPRPPAFQPALNHAMRYAQAAEERDQADFAVLAAFTQVRRPLHGGLADEQRAAGRAERGSVGSGETRRSALARGGMDLQCALHVAGVALRLAEIDVLQHAVMVVVLHLLLRCGGELVRLRAHGATAAVMPQGAVTAGCLGKEGVRMAWASRQCGRLKLQRGYALHNRQLE